jgi:hypothetical protein
LQGGYRILSLDAIAVLRHKANPQSGEALRVLNQPKKGEFLMVNLFVILSVFAIPVSIWVIVYFGSKIIMHLNIRRHLGDMPSAEEISELYKQNNARLISTGSRARHVRKKGKSHG